MFRFEHSWILYFLILLPVLYLLHQRATLWKLKQWQSLGDVSLIKQMMPHYSSGKPWIKLFLQLTAFVFIVIALANPQWGTKKEKISRDGSDLFILLDVSRSMDAVDVTPSRMDRAKQLALQLITQMKNNRFGIILFAGDAFIHMPLTSDPNAASLFIESANPNMVSTQGTALAEALDISQQAFSENSKGNQAVVAITDGEEHEGEAITAAQQLANKGIQVFTVGVGTTSGGFIPVLNEEGNLSYKVDENGEQVKTKLNESLLKDVASAGKGNYFYLQNTDNTVKNITDKIANLKKQSFELRSFSDYESYYQYFLIVALICLSLDFFISNRKNIKVSKLLFNE